MIVEAGPDTPPNFFLIGFRAPPGVTGPTAERVGVVILRSVMDFSGNARDAGDVRKEDEPFAGQPATGPFRYESEIAPWKPAPDVVVIDDLATFLTPAQLAAADLQAEVTNAAFGTLAVDRGTGFGPDVGRSFGWLARTTNPRLSLAGKPGPATDPSSLEGFDPEQFDLPDDFDNGFQNGRPLPGAAAFKAGDRLRFTDATGPVTTLTIPPPPELAVTQDENPLDPPLTLAPLVDTVVMDRGAAEFALIWRATFPWEPRFEAAVLEVR